MFGRTPVADYQLTKAKLARMAALIQAGRQFAYSVARKMATRRGNARSGDGQGLRLPRSRVGDPRGACRSTAAWATPRSTPSSRYFVDARVLSIFEGADETLCIRLIARRLVDLATS